MLSKGSHVKCLGASKMPWPPKVLAIQAWQLEFDPGTHSGRELTSEVVLWPLHVHHGTWKLEAPKSAFSVDCCRYSWSGNVTGSHSKFVLNIPHKHDFGLFATVWPDKAQKETLPQLTTALLRRSEFLLAQVMTATSGPKGVLSEERATALTHPWKMVVYWVLFPLSLNPQGQWHSFH